MYDMVVSAWNPIDGWISSDPTRVSIIERIGPIHINDFLILTDHVRIECWRPSVHVSSYFFRIQNETKDFEISLDRAGGKTCLVVDWGDYSPLEFWGNVASCQLRYPEVAPADVKVLDVTSRKILTSHVFTRRGLFDIKAFGFDERNYAETTLQVTVFKMACTHPMVWIADNHTDFVKWNAVPMIQKSKGFQKQAYSHLVCNTSTPT